MGAPFAIGRCGNEGERAMKGSEARNFRTLMGRFALRSGGETIAVMCPEKRFYPTQRQPTTEAAIDTTLLRDVYLVLGDKQEQGAGWAVRAYHKPLAVWIWLGSIVMGVGGLVSLSDRRYRVGAVAKRGQAAAMPAE